MATSVYVAAVEGFTGKSAVALGLLEQLSRRAERVAVYRPVIREDAQRDYVLDLLLAHGCRHARAYEECAGVTYDELHRDPDAALDKIVERFHRVAEQADVVLVVGSDYTDVGAPTEFSFNVRIAANLGSPDAAGPQRPRPLARGGAHRRRARRRGAARRPRHPVRRRGQPCRRAWTAADVVDALAELGVPVYAIPDEPLLSAPSVADLMAACEGTLVSGDESLLAQEATGVLVAAMTMPHVLDRLFDGAVVVTPGDRPEVVLGVLTAHASANFPQISGIVLNGGFRAAARR